MANDSKLGYHRVYIDIEVVQRKGSSVANSSARGRGCHHSSTGSRDHRVTGSPPSQVAHCRL